MAVHYRLFAFFAHPAQPGVLYQFYCIKKVVDFHGRARLTIRLPSARLVQSAKM